MSLHERLCFNGEQFLPPNAAPDTTLRLRLCVPEPHDCVHAVQPDHELGTQSTGQILALHVMTSDMCPVHGLPPCLGWTRISRLRERVPPPHVLEHAENWVHALRQ